jgi:hypothetical protein
MPRPRYHAAVSLALAALVVARSRRWRDALPILIAGVLVDLDHLVDLGVFRLCGRGSVVLPLHAWEWVLGLLVRGGRLTTGLAGGLATHLALDQLNRAVRHPFFYWIVVRAAHGFRPTAALVHPDEFEQSSSWRSDSPLSWF